MKITDVNRIQVEMRFSFSDTFDQLFKTEKER